MNTTSRPKTIFAIIILLVIILGTLVVGRHPMGNQITSRFTHV